MTEVTKDYHDGLKQAFDVIAVYLQGGGTITMEQLQQERNHYESIPVKQQSPIELERQDIQRHAAQVREYNKALAAIPENLEKVSAALIDFGSKHKGLITITE